MFCALRTTISYVLNIQRAGEIGELSPPTFCTLTLTPRDARHRRSARCRADLPRSARRPDCPIDDQTVAGRRWQIAADILKDDRHVHAGLFKACCCHG
jgi:hypothetical protein